MDVLDRCLDVARRGHPQVVVVEGLAGIGKTSLIRRFLDDCDATVLWSSGDEDEIDLPWGLLTQLAVAASRRGAPQLERVVAELDSQADPALVGAGLLELVGEEPLVLVADDVHWADPQSLSATRFAFRRLVADPVLLVLTCRPDQAGRLGSGWRRLLDDPDRSTRLRLEGLRAPEVAELSELLRGHRLSRQAASRLVEQTDGHPLYVRSVVEQLSVSALERTEDLPLPAPPDLAAAVTARLTACDRDTREIVELAAVMGRRARVVGLQAAAEVGSFADALGRAVELGLIREAPGAIGVEVEFEHVLVRSAIYHATSPQRRRELHARCASVLSGPVALVHRAAAAVGSDMGLADELARSAREHLAAGRLRQGAAELRRSMELTELGPARRARALEVVEAWLVAGDVDAADELDDELESAPDDAWSRYLRGWSALMHARVDEAESLLESAWEDLRDSPLPPDAPADLLARAASMRAVVAVVRLDYPAMVRFGEAAVQAGATDSRVRHFSWFVRLVGLALDGRSAEALTLLEGLDEPGHPGGLDGLVARGLIRLWTDDLRGAQDDLSMVRDRARAGEPLRVSQSLGYLGEVAYRRGQLEEAVVHAELAVEDATDGGRVWDLPILHALAAYPRAARGELDEAEAHASAASEWAAVMATRSGRAYAAVARACVADARDDAEALYSAGRDLAAAYDTREPGTYILGPVVATALVALGRLEEAGRELDAFERAVTRTGRRSALLAAARARGSWLAARQEWHHAEQQFRRSIDDAQRLCMPLAVVWAHLAWGRAAYRSGDRKAAQRELGAVVASGRAISAHAYTALATAMLEDLGLHVDTAGPIGAEMLTPTEGAVARLVASRLSNAEVAAKLMMSPKTVEYHLTHIYAKLGLRSRRELAQQLGAGAAVP